MKWQEMYDSSFVKWIESNPNYNIQLNPQLNPILHHSIANSNPTASLNSAYIVEPFEGIKKKKTRIILLILLILVMINYLIYIL